MINFLQNSQENQRLSQPITAGTPHTKKVTKGKKIKSQDTQASRGYSTLDRWFLPTSKQSSFLDSEGMSFFCSRFALHSYYRLLAYDCTEW